MRKAMLSARVHLEDYYKLKAKLALKGKTLQGWVEAMVRKEINGK